MSAQVSIIGNKQVRVAKAFDVPAPANLTVPAGVGGNEVPQVNPNYVFPKDLLSVFLRMYTHLDDPIWISGPTGPGKTSFVMQVAARLNIPVFYTTGKNTDAFDRWVGSMGLIATNGGTETNMNYGPLPLAMMTGGWFVVDEGDNTPPEQWLEANNVLMNGALTIEDNGGEVIKPQPGFRIIVLGNTNGSDAMTSAEYAGTKIQNMAVLDRFAQIRFSYPDKETEMAILEKSYPELGVGDRELMVDVANDTRLAADNPEVDFGRAVSTRVLLRWAKHMLVFIPLAKGKKVHPMVYGLERAFTAGLTEGEKSVIFDLLSNKSADLKQYFEAAEKKGVDPVVGPVLGDDDD